MTLMLQQKIREAKNISFDFDGVLLPKFLGRSWKNSLEKEHTRIEYFADYVVSLMRPPAFKVKLVLEALRKKGLKIYLLTGRDPKAFILAQKWLSHFGLIDFFSDSFHPDSVTLDPDKFKIDIIKFHNIDIHVDDSTELIKQASLDVPDRGFVLLGRSDILFKPNVAVIANWAKFHEVVKDKS